MVRTTPLRVVLVCVVAAAVALPAAASGTAIQSIHAADGDETDTPVAGTTVTINGVTNLRPDRNAITVDLEDSEGDIVASTGTDRWGQDGVWSVTIDTSGLEPGEYTVVADDGYDSDIETIRLVSTTPTPSETPTPEPTPTETATPDPTATVSPRPTGTPTGTATSTDTPASTEGNGPGFGVIVAVSALLAVALLAARRND